MTTTLIESRSNRLGIEVEHTTNGRGTERLKALRNGRPVAERAIARTGGRVLSLASVELVDTLSRDERQAIEAALDEATRVLRDGRGLCEVA